MLHLYDNIKIADLRTSIVAEWAIARLQIEGARQETLRVHHEEIVGVEAEAGSQQSNESSVSDLQDASKHPPIQDRSPTLIDRVNAEAKPADKTPKVSAHGSYKCVSGKHSGKLFVTSIGIRFETAVGSRDQWEIRYENMHRVEKVRITDPITTRPTEVLPLTAKLPLTDQSHCPNGFW